MTTIKTPLLSVLDYAQALMDAHMSHGYTCLALNEAAGILHVGEKREDTREYSRQFKAFVQKAYGGKLPNWWNRPAIEGGRAIRTIALAEFRKAIIAAAYKKPAAAKTQKTRKTVKTGKVTRVLATA